VANSEARAVTLQILFSFLLGICYNDTMHEAHTMLLAFDQYLAERRLQFDAVVIGGAALNLLGVVSRLTKDCDILHPEIPNEIAKVSRCFAIEVRAKGGTLQDNCLNKWTEFACESPSATMGGASPNCFCRHGHSSPLSPPRGSALRKTFRPLRSRYRSGRLPRSRAEHQRTGECASMAGATGCWP